MSEIKAVKDSHLPPQPIEGQPDLPAAPANGWALSSCCSACECVPCIAPLTGLAKAAWYNLTYFVQWVFGQTDMQRIDRFCSKWAHQAIPVAAGPYAQLQARWRADIKALPEEVRFHLLQRTADKYDDRIHWPENASESHEPYNAEEVDAILHCLNAPGDISVRLIVQTWIDRERAGDSEIECIDFLLANWPEAHDKAADHLSQHFDCLRWKEHLHLLSTESFDFAAETFAEQHPSEVEMEEFDPEIDELSRAQRQKLRTAIERRPGDSQFMAALRRYKQQEQEDVE